MRRVLFSIYALLLLLALACGFNFSTANIAEATMAKDPDGAEPVTTFNQDDTFYLVAQVANAPDDTTVKTVWTVIEADGVEPGYVLGEKELTGGGSVNFSLENEQLWPAGQYQVKLYLNGELDRTLTFVVEGDVAAQEATAVAQEPTSTPEPTPTPSPTPTLPLESTAPASASGGDTLSLAPTDTPFPEGPAEPEPLPFQAEPYVHPSGAFSIAVPEAWELVAEDEFSAALGDTMSQVGVVFLNPGAELTEAEMLDFVDDSLEIVVDTFANQPGYELIEEDNVLVEEGYYFAAVSFDEGDGQADFFYEQWESVIYILYFASYQYETMNPTWLEIIGSYQVDSQAALAADPAEEAAPAPAATAPPAPPGPAAPAGKGLMVFQNNTGVDFVIDVIGPTNVSEVVPPNSSHEFVLEPGHYTINGHSPGGDWAINAYEFDLAVGQVFPLNLN